MQLIVCKDLSQNDPLWDVILYLLTRCDVDMGNKILKFVFNSDVVLQAVSHFSSCLEVDFFQSSFLNPRCLGLPWS